MSNPYSPPRSPHAPLPAEAAYGWLIVLLAAVAMAATLPGRTHGLGLVTKHVLTDFPSLSQQGFGQINLWATLIGAAFCLPCGWLLDRFGLRIVLTCVLASLAAIVLWMARLRDVPSLIIAITLSRGIGQSMLSVVSITMIGKWFQRRIGIAMGVYSVQMSLLMAVGTGALSERINTAGWRTGWQELGLALAAVTPLCALLACDPQPQTSLSLSAERKSRAEPSATLGQALSTPCFWVFALAISFFGLVSSGVSLWQQLILEERGLPADVFRNVLVIGLLTGMVANLTAGALAQYVRLSRLLSGAMLLLSAAYVILPLARTPAHAYVFAVVQGLAGGMLTVLFFAVWSRAFGPAQLGRIQGAAQMMTVLASAFGPLLVAQSTSSTGTYSKILFGFAAVSATLGAVALLTPVPDARAWAQPAEPTISSVPQESLV
jgi:MFS family permease